MKETKSSKARLNMPLKLAIVQRSTQRAVSLAAAIGEVRLSKIVHGAPASVQERRAIARFLRLPQRKLFPPRAVAPAPPRRAPVVAAVAEEISHE